MMPKQPTQRPPGEQSGTVGNNTHGQSRPQELTVEQLRATTRTSRSSEPTLSPPAAAAGGDGATAWQENKRITALWSIGENRNAWVAVDGVGWKKLANNSDSAIVALNLLAASARQGNRPVNYREVGDGMIYELYLW